MILLGNLNAEQLEKRMNAKFDNEFREFLKTTNQPETNKIVAGQWHCFDIPFNIVCGDMETAQKIYEKIKPFSEDLSEELIISVEK